MARTPIITDARPFQM